MLFITHSIQIIQLTPFKIGGKLNHTVKYADDLVLLAKKEMVLQGMIDRLIDIGRCCGMEMKVEKCKVMRISRQTSHFNIVIDLKQLKNVEYFNDMGSTITNDARCTREIKARIVMAKAGDFSPANWTYF